MSLILPHRAHKPTIVATRSMFVLHNKLKRLALWQSTHSRCGMQGIQYISYMIVIIKFKCKVTPKVNQVCSPYCSRSFFSEIASKLFQTFCDIGCHYALFLNILGAPAQSLALTIKLIALQFHCSSQCYCAPVVVFAIKQYLWCGSKPTARLWRIHQGYEQSWVHLAGTIKEFHRLQVLRDFLISTPCQDDFSEIIVFQLRMVIGEVDPILWSEE